MKERDDDLVRWIYHERDLRGQPWPPLQAPLSRSQRRRMARRDCTRGRRYGAAQIPLCWVFTTPTP